MLYAPPLLSDKSAEAPHRQGRCLSSPTRPPPDNLLSHRNRFVSTRPRQLLLHPLRNKNKSKGKQKEVKLQCCSTRPPTTSCCTRHLQQAKLGEHELLEMNSNSWTLH